MTRHQISRLGEIKGPSKYWSCIVVTPTRGASAYLRYLIFIINAAHLKDVRGWDTFENRVDESAFTIFEIRLPYEDPYFGWQVREQLKVLWSGIEAL
jgi:hypothetical protein